MTTEFYIGNLAQKQIQRKKTYRSLTLSNTAHSFHRALQYGV